MQDAALRFGDGATLPFTPCKKGYQPFAGSKPMYACPLHDKERRKRVQKDSGVFRKGEVDLNMFWTASPTKAKSEDSRKVKRAVDSSGTRRHAPDESDAENTPKLTDAKGTNSEENKRLKKEVESKEVYKDDPVTSDPGNMPQSADATAKST